MRGFKRLVLAFLMAAPLLGSLPGCSSSGGDSTCQRDCSGRFCGSDGCGGTCGTCGGVTPVCSGATCVADCTADCTGKVCGSDGCGGSCGSCSGGTPVCASGSCIAACTPNCVSKDCGDDGCGGSCGTCDSGAPMCAAGACVASCTPSCVAKDCGDNGCGGSCGSCGVGNTCQLGICAAPTVVYGRVTDGVNPAEGVTIQIDNLSAGTDANGDYRIENVVPGTKSVRATKAYYLPGSATVTVAAGTSTRVDLAMTAVGELHGRVTDSLTGVGIAGVEVTFGTRTSYSGADGTYYVTGIYPGSYQLSFTAPGYSPIVSWLAVPGGILTSLDRVLDQVGTVSGTVTAAEGGAAIVGATVLGGGAVTTTDVTGHYTLSGVSAGTPTIVATAAGYDSRTTTLILAPAGSASANFSLVTTSTAPSNINGHVYDGDTGTPVVGATVYVNGKSTTSVAGGAYSLTGVAASSSAYNYARMTGYADYSGYMAVAGGTTITRDYEIKLFRTLYLVVTDSVTHQPIIGASGGCTTGTDGWCSMQAVSGARTLSVSAAGYRTVQRAITVPAVPSSSVTVELAPVPVVCGTVRDASTTLPIDGASVDLLLMSQTLLKSTVSGGDGFFCLSCPEAYCGVYDWPWALSAWKAGYTNGMTSFHYPTDGTATVDVALAPAGTVP